MSADERRTATRPPPPVIESRKIADAFASAVRQNGDGRGMKARACLLTKGFVHDDVREQKADKYKVTPVREQRQHSSCVRAILGRARRREHLEIDLIEA